MDHLLLFFYLEHDDDHLYVYLQMIHALVVVTPSSKFYKVYTVLFYKYVGANISVANCMLHFSMFSPTKANVKLSNGNMGHDQWVGIILCCFCNCPITFMVRTVYYCAGHTSKNISSGDLKFYVGFQKVTYEPLENCDLFLLSRLSLEITVPDLKQFKLSSDRNFQGQHLKKQIYCCPKCLCHINT